MRYIYIITASSFMLLIFGGLNFWTVCLASACSGLVGLAGVGEIGSTTDPRQYEPASRWVWFVLTILNVGMYLYTLVLLFGFGLIDSFMDKAGF